MNYSVKVDPVLTTASSAKYVIEKGATQVSNQVYQSENYSNSQIVFNITALNAQTIVSRKVFVTTSVIVTLRAAAGVGLVFPTGDLAGVAGLRFLPLQQVTNTLGIQINNLQTTTNPAIYADALCRYGYNKDDRNLNLSLWPSMQDVSNQYADSYNSNMNPLGNLYENDVEQPRGAFEPVSLVQDALTGTATLRFTWSEQIILAPPINSSSKTDKYGFRGLSNMVITFTLTDLRRMFSYDNINGTPLDLLTGVNVVLDTSRPPNMELQWYTPGFSIDSSMAYMFPYAQIFYTQTDVGTFLGGETKFNVTTNSYQLQAIPSKIYLFARRSDQSRTAFDTDSYAYISSLNVSFGNQTGLLANFSEFLIYRNLMVANGWKHPFNVTKNKLGSVLCLDLGSSNIPLAESVAPGLMENTLLQITFTLTNLNPNPVQYSLYVVPIYDGLFFIDNQSASTNVNILSRQEIMNADVLSATSGEPVSSVDKILEGGDLLGQLKHFGSKAMDMIGKAKDFYGDNRENIYKAISIGKSLGSSAAELLPLLLASGLSQDASLDVLSGAGFSPLELASCNCSGGQLITNPATLLKGGVLPRKTLNKRNNLLNRF